MSSEWLCHNRRDDRPGICNCGHPVLSSGFAMGVLAGAVALCGAVALSHLLLARLVQTKTGSIWPVAWLLLALGAGSGLFNLILPVTATHGIGGALVLAGLLAMGAALDSKNAGPTSDPSGLWWILGVAGVLMVLAALLPLVTGRMVLGAALLLVVGWVTWRVRALVERNLPRLLFFAGLMVLGGWAAATLFAPVGTVIGVRVAVMAGALLLMYLTYM